jgi:hypothetical protein
MLTPTLIRKSASDLKSECADIIFDNELSRAEKHEALAETLSNWHLFMKGAEYGHEETRSEARKEAREIVRKETRREEGRKEMTALDELNAKATELRKSDPKLTKEMAFEKVYLNPGNRALAARLRAEESIRKTPMLSRSDQSRSGWIPGGDNDATHPQGTTPVDPRYYDGDPKGSTHAVTRMTDQTAHGASLDRLYQRYKTLCPGMTAKIFDDLVHDLRIREGYGLSSGDFTKRASAAKTTAADRVASRAAALASQHPGLSHDDAVTRVLARNKDLADAYAREQNT